MIDFRYFTNEAEEDFATAFSLLENSDYKHAVFNIQLAFEKYLKAFFLKHGIIQNPREIGHIKYSQIVKNLIELIDQDAKRFPDNQRIQKNSIIMIDYLTKNKNFFQKLETKEFYQLPIWKHSLGIPLTKNDENLLTGIKTELTQILASFFGDLTQLMKEPPKDESVSPLRNTKAYEEFSLLFATAFKEANEKGIENVDSYEYLSKMENILKPILFGNGPDSMNLEDTIFTQKLFPLLRSMKWFDESFASYCHRQISQYPVFIEGKYSGDLYKENSENLKKFFEKIRKNCNEIKQEILPN